MKYVDFEKFVREKCVYETIYNDRDGGQILIIEMLDAYCMVNKTQREWVGLTDEEKKAIYEKADSENWHDQPLLEVVEAKLREKNNG